MPEYLLRREQVVPKPVDEVFPFFADAANLDRLTPEWLRFEILTPTPIEMRPGALIDYRLRYRGFPIKWRTRIEEWRQNEVFIDTMLKGPYKKWHHTHLFEPVEGGTRLTDIVRYALPLGPLGALAHRFSVRKDVEQIFDYRIGKIAELFGSEAELPAA